MWRAALAGLAALMLTIGLGRFAFGPLVPALVREGWFSPSMAGYLGATTLFGYMFGAGSAQAMARRFPAHWIVRVSMLVCATTFLLGAAKFGFAWHFALRLIAGVVGGWTMVLTVPAVIASAPYPRRGLVGGVLFASMGMGIVASGTLAPWLLSYSLPTAWISFALISCALAAAAWFGLPHVAPTGKRTAQTSLGRPTFPIICVALAYACGSAAFAPHTVFWADFIARYLEQGIPVAGLVWVLLGIGAAIIPTLAGLAADRIGFSLALRLSLFCFGIVVGLPFFVHNIYVLAASSPIVGGFSIAIASVASGRTAEMVGAARHRAFWGVLTMLTGLSHAGMAYLLAFILGQTGSYPVLFLIGGSVSILGAGLEWLGTRRAGTDQREAA